MKGYIIELLLCVRHCPELDMLYLIYLIYLTTTHMRKTLPRIGLIKFKSEYYYLIMEKLQRGRAPLRQEVNILPSNFSYMNSALKRATAQS